ncbi:hypothetical protein CC77DRAFT_1015059 [Alternaria alternata]|uniref:Uncharacterized protein n=1 Tax=Alternaria alternata TaxID=5599 RepID=A0A177E2I3_ALTAL|nr:hypothetical protein CC77DRAFT_1015059 [Alternaria alternata]OAG25681.1 hypothetical protein CC77DRAFT_1015059 [Alternaria alternata]
MWAVPPVTNEGLHLLMFATCICHHTCSPFVLSVFPISFAVVLGRATHAALRWRLESGERCGTLDVLAGSTSLTSTIVFSAATVHGHFSRFIPSYNLDLVIW